MKKLSVITLLFLSFNSIAQTQPEPQKIIDEFFKLYKEKSSDAALDYLFGTNKWMNDSKDQIDNVKFKLNSTIIKSMGQYYGYDQITKKNIGNRIELHTFLLKYDKQPIRFNFLFYKPNDQWRLQTFSFDDNLKEELEEATKIFRLENQ